jgi:hypothetical protein
MLHLFRTCVRREQLWLSSRSAKGLHKAGKELVLYYYSSELHNYC